MRFKIVVLFAGGSTQECEVGSPIAIMVPLLVVNALKPLLGRLGEIERLTVERIS